MKGSGLRPQASGLRSQTSQRFMPTRTQQLGLLILLTALVVYVLLRVGW
jgi:hypothetical protein